MERFTTYREGTAVLQDENKIQEAIKKLAEFEDLEEKALEQAMKLYALAELEKSKQAARERVEALGYSNRIINILRQNRIYYVDELCSLTEYDILKMRHAGKTAVEEIKEKLKEHGLKLGA